MRLTSIIAACIMATNLAVLPAALADALTDLAAKASGPEGWRGETLPDGRRVALGVGTIGGARHGVAVGCADAKRPMLALWPTSDKALVVESSDALWAFTNGKAADALAAGLIDGNDKNFKLAIDGAPFPAGSAAIKAFEDAGKDCEQQTGWQYGNDDEQQLVWIYMRAQGESPQMMFGKPSAGWLQAELSCDTARKTLIIKSAVLPPKVKKGQTLPLTLTTGGQAFTASGRVDLFDDGDVAGFITARFTEPRKVIDALRGADTMTLKARDAAVTMPAGGAVALLPRFARDCGF